MALVLNVSRQVEHIELFIYFCRVIYLKQMFFFGAFSGNLLYLILAISYLAGCSALAFRSPEDQTKENKSAEIISAPVLYENIFDEHSVKSYIINTSLSDQEGSEEISIQPSTIPYFRILFIPPPFAQKSHFSGSALFSRPPPYSLV